ncbi:NADP oxidoreductase coenzyme F420-dependent [Kribbella flavida DSM 17836]|uniref:NADP oxidoreductase coenzyme F420-dependent n=1 Tax=Kribbella flavida (strain DSM 17836 / JCM 10339 / NBRC 14399) TaxID=479435 RepID=D2PNQ4_KRIFD|nr:NADP oxidoreductase coenzyme F420-dependent [Kribbella flavida DSM 17836]
MRIGILGNGRMAEALGGQWARAGHEIVIGGRAPRRAAELAERIGAAAGTLQEATRFGALTLLAVPAGAALETLRVVGAADGSLRGRVLVDCTNAVLHRGVAMTVDAMAETISEYAVGARVVKAFNLAADSVWRSAPHDFDGRPLGVPLCGDDDVAVEQVAVLARDLGCEPVKAGGLARARLLEATAAFAIGVWFAGADTRALFPPLENAF